MCALARKNVDLILDPFMFISFHINFKFIFSSLFLNSQWYSFCSTVLENCPSSSCLLWNTVHETSFTPPQPPHPQKISNWVRYYTILLRILSRNWNLWPLHLNPFPKFLPWILTLNPYPESLPWILTLNPYPESLPWILTPNPYP